MHLSKFVNKKSYEHIQYVLHRHPLTFFPSILLFGILASLPIIIYYLFATFFQSLQGTPIFILALLGVSLYYVGLLTFFFIEFVLYYLDVWVVTNDRIIDVDQITLFSRTISELDLASIQDVTTDIKGFFPTLFNYGEVIVKTASDNPNIIFHQVPRPNKVRAELVDLSDADKERHVLLRDGITKVQ